MNSVYERNRRTPTNVISQISIRILIFSSFWDNYQIYFICIIIGTDDAEYEISNINFINNSQNVSGYGLILADGPTTIKQSTILGNNKSVIWLYGRTNEGNRSCITLVDCTIDDNIEDHITGNVTHVEISTSNSFIIAIRGTSNDYCEGKYDVYESLFPHPDEVFKNEAIRNKKDKQTCTQNIQQKKGDGVDLSKWRIVEYILVIGGLNPKPKFWWMIRINLGIK